VTSCGSISVLYVAEAGEGPTRVRAGRIHTEGGRRPDRPCVSDRVLCAAGAAGAAAPLRPKKMAVVC